MSTEDKSGGQTSVTANADAAAARARDLHEQILQSARKAGGVYVNAYAGTLQSIASFRNQSPRRVRLTGSRPC